MSAAISVLLRPVHLTQAAKTKHQNLLHFAHDEISSIYEIR
jgi:hypothetical protein